MGVVLVHTHDLYPAIIHYPYLMIATGARGVQLFFVASALTLCMSWHARNSTIPEFWLRRVFRIAPMFWLSILIYQIFGTERFAAEQVGAAALFVNGWSPNTYLGVTPGGWSIGIEMGFYLLFPAFVAIITNLSRALIFFAVSTIVAVVTYPIAADMGGKAFGFGWLGDQLPAFAAGFVAYYCITTAPWRRATRWLSVAGVLIALGLVVLPAFPSLRTPDEHLSVPIYAALFVALAYVLANSKSAFANNLITRRLGVLSYSIYLLHFLVISAIAPLTEGLDAWTFLITYKAVLALSAAVAEATFRLIERPGQRLGKAVIRALFGRRMQYRASAP